MNLTERILSPDPETRARAVGEVADRMRGQAMPGGYRRTLEYIGLAYAQAGRVIPSDAEVDAWLAEADDLESAS
jgi:hypothetical protein